jgi:hypothetical protein
LVTPQLQHSEQHSEQHSQQRRGVGPTISLLAQALSVSHFGAGMVAAVALKGFWVAQRGSNGGLMVERTVWSHEGVLCCALRERMEPTELKTGAL